MKKTILGLSLLLSLAVCNTTQAQDRADDQGERKGPPPVSELLKKMDTNEDGKLAKTEVKGKLSEHFDLIDIDQDGFITEEEMKKAPKPSGKGKREEN